LTLVGCHIESGSVAIEQMGTGDVVMRDSTIIGRKAAVSLMGTGNIRAKGCTIVGAVKKTGTGRFIDEGGNTRKKR